MIMIISHAEDDHAALVISRLEQRGRKVLLFDLAGFPASATIAMGYSRDVAASLTLGINGENVNLRSCNVAWWRRPQPFEIPSVVADLGEQSFAHAECHEAISGLWHTLDLIWINDPQRDDVASRKSYQLDVAAQVGLAIPKTLITNDPDSARDFIESQGLKRTIYKAFSATPRDWRETRTLRKEEMELLDRVQLAPVIFQEFVEAECDLRVTIMGKKVFAAAIYSAQNAYEADYRMNLEGARVVSTKLPEEISGQLLTLMDKLGLVYGAIDLRKTPEGEYVFLEINPAGQWRFIEQRTGEPITDEMAQLLIDYDVRRSRRQ